MAAVHYQLGDFPPAELDWPQLIPLLGPASAAVARYDGTLAAVPNASVLLSPLTTQEAVLSSRIEGTQATMGEVLEFEAEGDSPGLSNERRNDIHEVLNYRAAMRMTEKMLADVPLSQRVIREAHKVLLDGVRGQGKAPGEYRRIPNWIGPAGCTVEQARFVPISADKLPDGMSAWERYLHANAADRLVQLAILHAEFEALHPFLDGNGRLGRMLVPLFMWQNGVIQRPMFYLSAFLEAHRDEYYERLLAVSRDGDWTAWCRFFLQAIKAQAEENQQKAGDILALYERMKREVTDLTRSQYSIHALDWIFERPIFKSSDFVSSAGIPEPTAKRILPALREAGVLRVLMEASGRRAATLCFPTLLNIAEGREAF
ncbi:MAG: cell filamentation protein Fic [Pusillimonas sp.]|nr:cell filamentation protein Fic [Pusillimonas sp.]MBC43195.1 cell filamentation protein Fic [Pusillimonas sp.]HCP76930.1 cell filamentation protein Fic [Pusillimonas sp.]|tara:strand:+ start:22113 stop:23231 length:1119 start_codon:yes stop_codon:yes gene_type:complete